MNRVSQLLPPFCQKPAKTATRIVHKQSLVGSLATITCLLEQAALYPAVSDGHCQRTQLRDAWRQLQQVLAGPRAKCFITCTTILLHPHMLNRMFTTSQQRTTQNSVTAREGESEAHLSCAPVTKAVTMSHMCPMPFILTTTSSSGLTQPSVVAAGHNLWLKSLHCMGFNPHAMQISHTFNYDQCVHVACNTLCMNGITLC
jgi:hypothetical protein